MKLRVIHTPMRSSTGVTTIGRAYRSLMTHSLKMMWGCIAIVVLAVVLSVALSNSALLLFLIPCMFMMGLMVWMMMGGMGGMGGRGKK